MSALTGRVEVRNRKIDRERAEIAEYGGQSDLEKQKSRDWGFVTRAWPLGAQVNGRVVGSILTLACLDAKNLR